MPWVKIGLVWLGVVEGGTTQNIPWNTLFILLNTGGLLNFLAFLVQPSYEGSLYSKAVFVWKSFFLNHGQQLL